MHHIFGKNLLMGLALAFLTVPLTAQAVLDWSDPRVVWNDGDLTNTYAMANGVEVTITVSVDRDTNGEFKLGDLMTPYEDDPALDDDPDDPDDLDRFHFGTGHDLGVIFDPAPSQGQSPVTITAEFSEPVSDVAFEISDIDYSRDGNSGPRRIDQVVVTCDGLPAFLEAKAEMPSFEVVGNQATSVGQTSVDPGSDQGTVLVDCGGDKISLVEVIYNEMSPDSDPPARGIGLFYALAEVPVELMSFSID